LAQAGTASCIAFPERFPFLLRLFAKSGLNRPLFLFR
jgi:hypothetical protein